MRGDLRIDHLSDIELPFLPAAQPDGMRGIMKAHGVRRGSKREQQSVNRVKFWRRFRRHRKISPFFRDFSAMILLYPAGKYQEGGIIKFYKNFSIQNDKIGV